MSDPTKLVIKLLSIISESDKTEKENRWQLKFHESTSRKFLEISG